MVKTKVNSGSALNPGLSDLRYVKRFLVETADHTNHRIGRRLADLLTERYQDDSTLFAPQALADSISKSFQQSLTISGFAGTP
jgi:hypothetical protein